MLDIVQHFLQNTLGGSHQEIIVFILSMTPLIELRGGIVAGYFYDFPLLKTLSLTIFANLIPIPFILFFIKHIFKWMRKHNILTNLINKVTSRALGKSDRIKKLEFWGLILYVGIPLPGTGAWTGALIASLLNIDIKKASLAIFLGILLAATIMSLTTYGFIDLLF